MAKAERLTRLQAKFVEAYLANGGHASDAYKASYSCASMAPLSIYKEAARVMRYPLVAAAIAQVQERAAQRAEQVAERHAVTKEWLVERLSGAFSSAIEDKSYAGAGRLGELLAKLQGLIVERRDVRMIKSMRDLTDEELADLAREGEREKREGVRH